MCVFVVFQILTFAKKNMVVEGCFPKGIFVTTKVFMLSLGQVKQFKYYLNSFLISLKVSELLSETAKGSIALRDLYTSLMCDWAAKIVTVVLTLYRSMKRQSLI